MGKVRGRAHGAPRRRRKDELERAGAGGGGRATSRASEIVKTIVVPGRLVNFVVQMSRPR